MKNSSAKSVMSVLLATFMASTAAADEHTISLPGTAGATGGGAAAAAGVGVKSGAAAIKVTGISRAEDGTITLSHGRGHAVAGAVGRGYKGVSKARAVADAEVGGTITLNGRTRVVAKASSGASGYAKNKNGQVAAIKGKTPVVIASATGGAVPKASAQVGGLKSHAVGGVNATASGGTNNYAKRTGGRTIITGYFGNGTISIGTIYGYALAVSYNDHSFVAAEEFGGRHPRASAWARTAKTGDSFTSADLNATIALAASAYATAGNNYAYGSAGANAYGSGRTKHSDAEAYAEAYATAFVNGVPEAAPKSLPVNPAAFTAERSSNRCNYDIEHKKYPKSKYYWKFPCVYEPGH